MSYVHEDDQVQVFDSRELFCMALLSALMALDQLSGQQVSISYKYIVYKEWIQLDNKT